MPRVIVEIEGLDDRINTKVEMNAGFETDQVFETLDTAVTAAKNAYRTAMLPYEREKKNG